MKINQTDLAYLTALISGDGTVTKYYIRISDKHKKNLQYIKLLLKNNNIKSYLKREKPRKFILEINSRKFIEYLDIMFGIKQGIKKKIIIPKNNLTLFKIKKAYMQGWFDAEGYIENWKKPKTKKIYLRVHFGCKNRNVVLWLKKELERLNMKVSKVWFNSKTYRFQIGQQESVNAFLKIIGFRYPTKTVFSRTV